MAKSYVDDEGFSDLRAIPGEFSSGDLVISNSQLWLRSDERLVLTHEKIDILHKFLSNYASCIETVLFDNVVNPTGRRIDSSWIAHAPNLKSIHFTNTWQIFSNALAEDIIENESILHVEHDFSLEKRNFHYHEYQSINKMDAAVLPRSAQCVELGVVNPKFGQLGFNSWSLTWLPYDTANKKWKLQELTYDEYTQSLSAPGLDLPPPQGVKLSKIAKIKAEGATRSIESIKHEVTARQEDVASLKTKRDSLIKLIEEDPENDATLAEFSEISGLIGNHNKQIAALEALEERIPQIRAETIAKLEAQKALDKKFTNIFFSCIHEDFSAIEHLLLEGADIYARGYGGYTRLERAVQSEYYLKAATFLTQMQAEQDARDEAAKSKVSDSAAKAMEGSLDHVEEEADVGPVSAAAGGAGAAHSEMHALGLDSSAAETD